MDLTDTIAPTSDQMDAEDLLSGPRTFTITKVTGGSTEQPVNIHLAEFDRPFRPSKTVRRLLVAAWGGKGDTYVGRRLVLYRDPDVKFGGIAVGGIRVSHMSDLPDNEPLSLVLMTSKGKRATYVVKPLTKPAPTTTAPTPQTLDQRIEAATAAYARANVTVPMLEAKVALPRDEWGEQTVANLEALYARLVARETTKEAEFDMPGDDQ